MAHYLRTSPDFNPARYVKIIGTETVDTYTVYILELSFGPYRWMVKHRYNEFRDLHDRLVSKHKLERNLLPPKKLFGNNSESFIRKRQGELELYLQTLLYKLKTVAHELGLFLEFNQYEIHGITQVLAEELYHRGDLILQSGEPYKVSPLQLYAITNRLKLPEPTCDSGDAMKDIGHILDFVTRIKRLKIIGQRDQLGASNILMNDLNYDLSMFKSLEDLELAFCNPSKICATEGIKKSVKRLRVFNTVSTLKEILLVDVAFGQWLGSAEEAVLVPIWTCLAAADFSYNGLETIDESVKLMPKVECVDLSHNSLSGISHLEHLSCLTHLDLSYNNIHTLDALHTKLGNIKTLSLAHNKLESLQGFSKLYSLEKLDLSNNEISQVLEVDHLSCLPCLELLKLTDNPVTIVLDYRTKVLEFFKDRAKEVALDGAKPTQKELDTVAILLALQKSKQSREKTRKHRKAREAKIVDPSSDSSRGHSPTLGHRSYSLPTFQSRPQTHHHNQAPGETPTTSGPAPHVVRAPSPQAARATSPRDQSVKGSSPPQGPCVKGSSPSRGQFSVYEAPGPSSSQQPIRTQGTGQGTGQHKETEQKPDSDRVKPTQPRLGYQPHLDWESPESLVPQSGTMLPETLPSRNDATFMTHLQELLPSTSALTRRSRTRDDRREQQEERTMHVMWCTALCYTRPFRELMACICVTTENLHLLEVHGLRSDQGMPKLVHIYCIPLVNLQQIILGYQRQYLRIEEAFVGPQGTYALLTGSMAKTDLFLDSLKLAYRRAISDIDQYEDPHITANGDTEKNLLRTLNHMEGLDSAEDISVSLYMLVNGIDYSQATRPFVTHSLVMTSRYIFLLREDYVMWPQATFAIGISTRSQFLVSCAFPIMGKITGIQMYDSDTYSPDQDTSLSQTFSATKTCAMVVPNFIGYGVKLTFDMGSQGPQSVDIRVPTSGMRDRFLATLTQLRKDHSERMSGSPRPGRHRVKLRDVDTDSLSTNSGGSNHGARHRYQKHTTPTRHRHRHKRYEARKAERGQRPDLLPNLNQLPSWTSEQTDTPPEESHTAEDGIPTGEPDSCPDQDDSNSHDDSNDEVTYPAGLPVREAPIGQSGNSDDSSDSDETELDIPAFVLGSQDESLSRPLSQNNSKNTSGDEATAQDPSAVRDIITDVTQQQCIAPGEHITTEHNTQDRITEYFSEKTPLYVDAPESNPDSINIESVGSTTSPGTSVKRHFSPTLQSSSSPTTSVHSLDPQTTVTSTVHNLGPDAIVTPVVYSMAPDITGNHTESTPSPATSIHNLISDATQTLNVQSLAFDSARFPTLDNVGPDTTETPTVHSLSSDTTGSPGIHMSVGGPADTTGASNVQCPRPNSPRTPTIQNLGSDDTGSPSIRSLSFDDATETPTLRNVGSGITGTPPTVHSVCPDSIGTVAVQSPPQFSGSMNPSSLSTSCLEADQVGESPDQSGPPARPTTLVSPCDGSLDTSGRDMSLVGTTPPARPSILKTQLSLDVQYPGMSLLSHLTECNEQIQMLEPLSDVMRNLCSMEGDELLNHFHGCVAQIGQSTEELRHVLWTPVLLYDKPQNEVVSCVMVSTKAVYFVSDHDPRGHLTRLKEWKSHSRNKSDSYKMFTRDPMAGACDLHLTAGVVHQCKQMSSKSLRIPKTYAVLPLKDIRKVTVGLFDQSFRLVGPTAETTFTCMTRDNRLTTDFIRNLTSVLAMVNPTPSPDQPGTDSEQDFYSMFTTYSRLESQEYKHSSKVRFIYPNEDLISELLFVISESDTTSRPRPEIHLLLYLTVFMRDAPGDGSGRPHCATIPETTADDGPAEMGRPLTLIMSEPYLTVCREDHVHYPIPDFAFGPPAFPRLRILENRHLSHLRRIVVSDSSPHHLTLVFTDEKDMVVNPEFDHYSPYGGRVRRHITPTPEVSMVITIQSLSYKDKFIGLLRKQWAELQTLGQELEVLVDS